MLRIVICSAVLLAVIAALKWLLNTSIDNMGLGWGALIGAAILIPVIIGAYLYDRANTHSQEVLPPARRDSQ